MNAVPTALINASLFAILPLMGMFIMLMIVLLRKQGGVVAEAVSRQR